MAPKSIEWPRNSQEPVPQPSREGWLALALKGIGPRPGLDRGPNSQIEPRKLARRPVLPRPARTPSGPVGRAAEKASARLRSYAIPGRWRGAWKHSIARPACGGTSDARDRSMNDFRSRIGVANTRRLVKIKDSRPGVFSLFDFSLIWCFQGWLILFHLLSPGRALVNSQGR